MRRGSSLPIGTRSTTSAAGSYWVGSALTITSRAPLWSASSRSQAAGKTDNYVPIARNRSHAEVAVHDRLYGVGC